MNTVLIIILSIWCYTSHVDRKEIHQKIDNLEERVEVVEEKLNVPPQKDLDKFEERLRKIYRK